VRKSSILPAQHDSDVGREGLLRTVDVADIDDPNSDGNLSWSGF
jgi:hypothetical protein